jgi:hypothetical protein
MKAILHDDKSRDKATASEPRFPDNVDWGAVLCRLAVNHWGEPDQCGQFE